MTERLEYRVSIYTVFFYLLTLTAAVFVHVQAVVAAAALMLSPVVTVLSVPTLVMAVVGERTFWMAAILLLLPHAFIATAIHRDARENAKTELWPLTVVLFGLPAVFLYGHLRMRDTATN
ncbi:MAG: hypothetical protein SVW77_01250 [Candidatus Nanohaloarchaea archaeon]|nr:hypothetical protein [Candidatus Nanohaloarchaea archaeon]